MTRKSPKPRRQYYALEAQINEFTFSCGGTPGINLLKAYNGDTQDLDGRMDLMFSNYGKKVTYIMMLERQEFSQQKYAQKAKRTVNREEVVKQISQVGLGAIKAECAKGNDEARIALQGWRLTALRRVGKSSFMCQLERESSSTSHVQAKKNHQGNNLSRNGTSPKPSHLPHPSATSTSTRSAPPPQPSYPAPPSNGSVTRRGSVSTWPQDFADVYALTTQQPIKADGWGWRHDISDVTTGFDGTSRATYPQPAENPTVYAIAEYGSTPYAPSPQHHYPSLTRGDGNAAASSNAYIPACSIPSSTSVHTFSNTQSSPTEFYDHLDIESSLPHPLLPPYVMSGSGRRESSTSPLSIQLSETELSELCDPDYLFIEV